jgi:hypothetical protein
MMAPDIIPSTPDQQKNGENDEAARLRRKSRLPQFGVHWLLKFDFLELRTRHKK